LRHDDAKTRRQRRLEDKQKAKRLAKLARSAPPPSRAGLAEQTEVLLGVLQNAGDGRRASHAADAAHRGFDRSMAEHFRAKDVACRRGCAFCCHAYVSVSVPEALLVARTIRSLPEPRRSTALARIREIDDRTRGRPPEERIGEGALPCPLLVDNRCSVYDVRPFGCRAEMSTDASACERLVNGLDARKISPVLPPNLKMMYSSALAVAVKNVGLTAGIHEFNAALRIAVDSEDAEERWLAGEDLFAAAAIHPSARKKIEEALIPASR
jgi:hypothetical protein